MFETIDVQKRVRRWVESRLGVAAMDPRERAMRVFEEATELAQACGVSHEDTFKIWQHVYSKDAGDPQQELGGVALTLLGCAEGLGYVLSQCANSEMERIESAPPERFVNRQRFNVNIGIGAAPGNPDAV